MYKRILSIALVSLSIIVTSCDNEDLTLSSPQPPADLSSPTHTDATTNLIDNIFNQIYGISSRATTERTVKNCTIIYDTVTPSQIDTAFIITNYNDGGFSIVEKLNNAPKVIALSDQGEFDLECASGKFIIKSAIDNRNERLSTPGVIEPSPLEPTPDYLGMSIWHGDHYCSPRGYYTTLGQQRAFVKAAWHQGDPYYHKMFQNGYSVAGCGTIAVAQVLNHFQKPEYLNGYYCSWESFQNDSTVTYETPHWTNLSNAIYEIAIGCKAVAHDFATTVKLKDVTSYLKSIGYAIATYTTGFNESTILNDLSCRRPIIICGQMNINEYGHAWILDGFHQLRFDKYYYRQDNNLLCNQTHETLTYYHCKWGEPDKNGNGNDNGYFLFNNFGWNLNMSFIHNIKYTK
ncbi:MAG: C10 family peptidase [Paramuribaculum sp.]|nr:C10 family peptidase [Paramuribaculum sp.]